MILKFTIRNLQKRPFLNLVKIIGLSLALSGILLIVIFLKTELNYDNFHKNSKNIYRFSKTNKQFFGGKHFARVLFPDPETPTKCSLSTRIVPGSPGLALPGQPPLTTYLAFDSVARVRSISFTYRARIYLSSFSMNVPRVKQRLVPSSSRRTTAGQ